MPWMLNVEAIVVVPTDNFVAVVVARVEVPEIVNPLVEVAGVNAVPVSDQKLVEVVIYPAGFDDL